MVPHVNNLTNAEMERLTILSEECSEVIQNVCKIKRFGYSAFDPRPGVDHTPNREKLEKEMGDLKCIINRMEVAFDISKERTDALALKKHEKMRPWLIYQDDALFGLNT